MGTVGSVVTAAMSGTSANGLPGSVQTNWVQVHDNLEAAADTTSIYLKPYNSSKTSFHWCRVPDGATRLLVRGKVSAGTDTITTAPVIAIIGAHGADPNTTTNNFSGTVDDANWAKYTRLDTNNQDGTGLTLTLNVTTAGFEDTGFIYGDPYDLTGIDVKGARYVGIMVITAAAVTGGSAHVAYGEFAFLN